MDIRQLRYFLIVAQQGQITGAAKLLHMEQPPLSRQMKQIEEELGVTLFDRSGNRLRLTPAGERLRVRAEELLRRLEESLTEVREFDEGVRGVLAIGAVVSCLSLLPGPLALFRERYPHVNFKIAEGDHHLLSQRLDNHEIEVAAARLPFEAGGDPARFETVRLPSDPFVALVPAPGAPPQEEEPPVMRLRELAVHPFITLKTDRTVGMHESIMNAFAESGIRPRVLCECGSVAITLSLVAGGLGVAVLPKSATTALPLAGIRVHALEDAPLPSEVGLVWRKDRYLSNAARHFLALFHPLDLPSAGQGDGLPSNRQQPQSEL